MDKKVLMHLRTPPVYQVHGYKKYMFYSLEWLKTNTEAIAHTADNQVNGHKKVL
jgi:hypothetical protein